MTPGDTARVLAKAAAYDQRTIGEADVLAWHDAIGDLDFADAMAAVTRHYRDHIERMMPAHVRKAVAEIRAGRRPAIAAPEANPPDWPAVRAMLAELRKTLPPGKPGIFGRQLIDATKDTAP